MNVAFYAPMKTPQSPVPSGDRRVARELVAALEHTGHAVRIASAFSSYQGEANTVLSENFCSMARTLADDLIVKFRAERPEARPALWFTYHVYYKAPDWIGPVVAQTLKIPYVVAEASYAPKRADGPWARNLAAVEDAIRASDLILGLNSADTPCVRPLLADPARHVQLRPFLRMEGAAKPPKARPASPVRLLCVAMMRAGAKLDSYRVLAETLAHLETKDWRLTIVGDGPAADEIRALFSRPEVEFVGRLSEAELGVLYPTCDLFVWPAVGEAYGMAMLEAQAAGVPVVAGRSGGVGDIVRNGETGLLTEPGDAAGLAAAIDALIADPPRRARMAQAAAARARAEHGFEAAAATIDAHLRALVP